MPPSSTRSNAAGIVSTVRRTIAEHQLLVAGDRVMVGVSGGPDSMVLLHLLHRLAPELKISLGVAHLNHCLRGRCSDQDAQAVEQEASRLGLVCHLGNARVEKVRQRLKLSLEEAARRVRYAFFEKMMRDANYNKLALGHHRDDNAEQVMMALLRGSGPRGLSGIAPIRNRRIVRPLIHARRSQILAYAQHECIDWVVDASNHDLKFERNRIRHHLLPLLAAQYNPRINDRLSQLADVMRTEEEWIDELVTVPYTEALIKRQNGCLVFRLHALRRMHPALVRRLFRRALMEIGGTLRRIGFTHIRAMQRLVTDGGEGKTLHLPRGIRIRRRCDQLEFAQVKNHRRPGRHREQAGWPAGQIVLSSPFPRTVKVDAMGVGLTVFACRPEQVPPWPEIGPNQAFFDLDRLSLPLTLRAKQPGDRFVPLGSKGSQKIKQYFIDHHISREDRANTPVLADRRQIIWLVGQRIDDRLKVSPASTRILGAEYFLLDIR